MNDNRYQPTQYAYCEPPTVLGTDFKNGSEKKPSRMEEMIEKLNNQVKRNYDLVVELGKRLDPLINKGLIDGDKPLEESCSEAESKIIEDMRSLYERLDINNNLLIDIFKGLEL